MHLKGAVVQSSSTLSQTVAVIVAVISVLVLTHFVPQQSFYPHGIVLPAKQVRPATQPDTVRIYQVLPNTAQKLGRLSIEMHAAKGRNQRVDEARIIAKAQSLASSVGANGMVFDLMYGGSPEGSALNNYYLMGYAIYASVPDELNINFISPIES